MKNSFLQFGIEQKNFLAENNTLTIRGMASTRSLDRYNDIVEPMAFAKSIDLFMTNPVMLLQHNMDKPIGKFTSLKMTDDGLAVEGEVLHNEDGVIDKIKSGVLQAFSIGYIPKKYQVKNEAGEILATEEGIERGVSVEKLFDRKNTKTITELELVEISVVSIPANARSLFGVAESAKKFFDNLAENWAAEIKNLEEKPTETAQIEAEKSETSEVSEEVENTTNSDDIPALGDELQDTDNVANEIIAESETKNFSKNSDETISEKTDEKISEEKNFVENSKDFSEKIIESKEYRELEAKNLELVEMAKNLVTLVDEKNAEIAKLKHILQNTPVRKGLATLGQTPAKPKQKGFFEKMIDEANNS